MTAHNSRTRGVDVEPLVSIEEAFDFPRERVFDAWVKPHLLEQWFAPRGCTLHIVRMDVRPGGGFHWCIRNPAFGDCWTTGSYIEVLRPERIVFTSVIADADGFPATPESQGHDAAWPPETTVRVTFTERGGQTIVRLEQNVSEAVAKRTGAHPSWIEMLERLSLHLTAPPHAPDVLPQTLLESGYAPVNGIRMYYEVHGLKEGVPLVLLHGGGSTIESTFGQLLPFLAGRRYTIAIEEQGHGRTSDRNQPVSFESSADDVAALLRHLKVEQADLFGFSNGASVALQASIRHPELVRKLVFASSMTKKDGASPQLWEFIKQADFSNMPQPLKDAFLKVNPDVQKLKTMHDKDAARMQTFADVPDAAVRSVRASTLILIGDQDVVRPEHAVELTHLFPHARLIILPSGHGGYLGEVVTTPERTDDPELTARLIERFLSMP